MLFTIGKEGQLLVFVTLGDFTFCVNKTIGILYDDSFKRASIYFENRENPIMIKVTNDQWHIFYKQFMGIKEKEK